MSVPQFPYRTLMDPIKEPLKVYSFLRVSESLGLSQVPPAPPAPPAPSPAEVAARNSQGGSVGGFRV